MSQRYFLTNPPAGSRAVLEGDEARHVTRVMRAQPGDELEVFDGQGHWWTAKVLGIERGAVRLELGACQSEPVTKPSLTLAVALPKGDRQKWLIEKLTELGVDRLIPLRTVRGVAAPTAAAPARNVRRELSCSRMLVFACSILSASVPSVGSWVMIDQCTRLVQASIQARYTRMISGFSPKFNPISLPEAKWDGYDNQNKPATSVPGDPDQKDESNRLEDSNEHDRALGNHRHLCRKPHVQYRIEKEEIQR